jgi:hypothetical protein
MNYYNACYNNQVKRVVIIYNPRSSKASMVEKSVLVPLREKYANLLEYQIKPTNFQDNVVKITTLIKNHDIIIAAGGDGTAAIASNAALSAAKPSVVIGYLGFGNFNDLAGTFTPKSATVFDLINHSDHTIKLRPLEIVVNDQFFRFAMLYATIGLLAKSTLEFEKPRVRNRVKHTKTRLIYSLLVLMKFYFHSRRHFKHQPDLIAINGRRAAKILRTSTNYYASGRFKITQPNLAFFPALVWFMLRSLFGRMSGQNTRRHIAEFTPAADLHFQAEGEYFHLKSVQKLQINKSAAHLNVIAP